MYVYLKIGRSSLNYNEFDIILRVNVPFINKFILAYFEYKFLNKQAKINLPVFLDSGRILKKAHIGLLFNYLYQNIFFLAIFKY